MARHDADWLVEKLGRQDHGVSAVCMSGGETTRILYETLAKMPLPWKRIHWFWCDERFVPSADERSNYHMVEELLLARVPVPRVNIHAIPTAFATP